MAIPHARFARAFFARNSRFAGSFGQAPKGSRFFTAGGAQDVPAFLRGRTTGFCGASTTLPAPLAGQHCSLLTAGKAALLSSAENGVSTLVRELSTTAGGEGDPADSFGAIVDVDSDADFDAILVKLPRARTAVIDFHAQWCGPCKVLGPALAKVCSEHKVQLIKVDVDGAPAAAAAFGVASLPTVVAYRDGKPVGRFVGAQPPARINDFVSKFV